MSAVLAVVGRPESFCGRIVALVEECVEHLQDHGLVLVGCSLRHLDLPAFARLSLHALLTLLVTASAHRLPEYWPCDPARAVRRENATVGDVFGLANSPQCLQSQGDLATCFRLRKIRHLRIDYFGCDHVYADAGGPRIDAQFLTRISNAPLLAAKQELKGFPSWAFQLQRVPR